MMNLKADKPNSSESGMTIIELLVALAIGLVLLAGMYQVFFGSTQTYAVTDRLSRMQENARFLTQYLRREVRMAGFMGCAQDATAYTNTLKGGGDFMFQFDQAVYGLEATAANTWADNSGNIDPTAVGGNAMGLTNPVSGSDILVLRGVDTALDVVMESSIPNPTISADMKVTDGTPGISDDDILMISDCEHASIFQVTNYTQASGNVVHNAPGGCAPAVGAADFPCNATKDLGHVYTAGSEIFRPRTVSYYIRNNVNAVPSLYRKINLGAVEELVEGVEHMQVRYGVDTDGDRTVDQYMNANGIGNWSNVYSVRVGVVLRSVRPIGRGALDTSTYDADGNGIPEYDPVDDRRLRMVVHMTSALRNRLR